MFIFSYLTVQHRLLYRRALVILVQFGCLTHYTDGLLVNQTEEFKLLPVQAAVRLVFLQQ